MKAAVALGVVMIGLCLAACDTTSPEAAYTPLTSNVLAFQSALRPTAATVQTGQFSEAAGVEIPTCRMLGKLDVSAGKSLAAYVKDAMQTELFTAGVYSVDSRVVITGLLDEVKVNTFGKGSWTLGLKLSSTKNPGGYHVAVTRPFASSYTATAACRNAAAAFAPTVQDLLTQVVSNPGFADLAGIKSASAIGSSLSY